MSYDGYQNSQIYLVFELMHRLRSCFGMVQIRSYQMPAPFLLDLELTHFGPNLIHKSYVTRLKSEPERPTPHSLRRIHNTHKQTHAMCTLLFLFMF